MQPAQRLEGPGPDVLRIELGQPRVARRHAERMPQVMRQGHVQLERLDLQLDLGRYQVGRLAGRDPAGIAHQLEQRQVRNRGPVGQAAALHHGRPWLGQAAELPGQPGLAQAGVTGQAHHLALAADRQVQRPAKLSEFTVAAGERAQVVT